MNTKMKIGKHSDGFMAKVLSDLICEKEMNIKEFESSCNLDRQKIKERRAKKYEDYKSRLSPSPCLFKGLQIHNLNEINDLYEDIEYNESAVERCKAEIQGYKNLLAVLIKYDFNFKIILQDRLVTLKESLQLVVNSVLYILWYCDESPVCEYQSLIDLIQVIMCQLDTNKPIVANESYWQEKYERCLETEKKNIDMYLYLDDLVFPRDWQKVADNSITSVETLNDEITDCFDNISDTSLYRQLYVWLYIVMQMISKKTL